MSASGIGEGPKAQSGKRMPLFLSKYVNKVDKKGRVSVPAQYRAALPKEGVPGVIVSPSLKLKCLDCADYEFIEKLSSGIYGNFGLFTDQHNEVATSVFGDSDLLQFDPNGRITLSDDLRKYANIDSNALFVGLGKTFQIWEPKAFELHRASIRDQAIEAAATMRPVENPGGAL